MSVTVSLNGEQRQFTTGTSVAQLISLVTAQDKGIAVAVNGEVLPRRHWAATALADRDQVEIVTAVQGG